MAKGIYSEDEVITRLQRIGHVLTDYTKIVGAYLPEQNKKKAGRESSVWAFDLLERLYYNAKGALYMTEELGFNQNIAIPLSQIYRSVIYDIGMAYWLMEDEDKFEERLLSEDGSYIKKNAKRLEAFSNSEQIQDLYKSWSKISPRNFQVDGENFIPIKTSVSQFEQILLHIKQSNENTAAASLLWLYAALSQQAHISSFSKEMIYNRHDGIIKIFDVTGHAILVSSKMLLAKSEVGDYQKVSQDIDNLLKLTFPKP